MIEYKKITIEKDVPHLLICNRCGVEEYVGDELSLSENEMITVTAFDKTEEWQFQLCSNCFESLLTSLSIPPEKNPPF